jgi:chemotaxis protein methyltransferase CheR
MSFATQVEMSGAELKLLQSLLYQESGVYFEESRISVLQERVRRRVQSCGLGDFFSYYRLLTTREGKGELSLLLENCSVPASDFFSNKPQMELFQSVILSELLQRKQTRRDWRLRAWNAGCSTGQEAYTLAIQICDALSSFYLNHPAAQEVTRVKPLVPSPWHVEIMASDTAYAALQSAQSGLYLEKQMDGVDYTHRLRYFDKVAGRYAVKPSLKELMQFDMHNLKTEFLPPPSDIILCRNVLIYCDANEQKRLIEKFYRCLNPGGYLFVGQAESLFGLTDKFRMIHQNNGTAYQRIDRV